MSNEAQNYAKPGEIGGKLIREVISFYRAQQLLDGELSPVPIDSHILIAVSGGVDSIALAKLLIQYGRRVGSKFRILHINHGWRGEESDRDERFVRDAARRWHVPITIVRLKKKPVSAQAALSSDDGESLEARARSSRKKIFERLSKRYHAPVFTAHHADDFAETLIWRLFTGTSSTHGGGISFRHGVEIRPFLRVRKSALMAFLKEEGEAWREDQTNHEGRFLRSQLRMGVMPQLEKIFPRMVQRLLEQGLRAQSNLRSSLQVSTHQVKSSGQIPQHKESLASDFNSKSSSTDSVDFAVLFAAAGLAARKTHFDSLREIQKRVKSGQSRRGEFSLPGGWKLSWQTTSSGRQKWILEQS